MTREVACIGYGMTIFRRRLLETGKEMCWEAARMALDDAGLELKDIDMVIFGSAMGDPNVHNHKRVPFLVLGGANGKHKGGLHLWAPDETPAANVFLTLAHRLGMEDVTSFGDSTGEFAISDPSVAE